jgi:hypothetical protein
MEMTIKYVEKEITDTNEFGVFRNDYTESLSEQMEVTESGLYCSIPQQCVELHSFSDYTTRFVKGYDFGKGNLLSREHKIIECTQYLDEKNCMLYVAFTYSNEHDKSSFNVYLYRIDLKKNENKIALEDVDQNIFNVVNPEQLTGKGIYRRLTFSTKENMLAWDCFESTGAERLCQTTLYSLISSESREDAAWQQNIYNKHIEYLIEQTKNRTNKKSHCEQANENLYVVVIEPEHKQPQRKNPAIVVCFGGTNITIPDFYADESIYELFRRNGYFVIVPLRRGIIGISYEWEQAIVGRCGQEDINDIVAGTHFILRKYDNEIDADSIGLYGGSYGGFSALLINGKYNSRQIFKAIVSQCGVFDLETYPKECHGVEANIMNGYVNTSDKNVYVEKIKEISPHYFVKKWNVPTFLIHALDDNCVWFGQSVKAYNSALQNKKDVCLILNKGPHSYNVENIQSIFGLIMDFFQQNNNF